MHVKKNNNEVLKWIFFKRITDWYCK